MLCVSWLLHLQSLEWKNESLSYLCSHHAADFGVCDIEVTLSGLLGLGANGHTDFSKHRILASFCALKGCVNVLY